LLVVVAAVKGVVAVKVLVAVVLVAI